MDQIDINFNGFSDTPEGKDPDSHSPTLRKYHKILWSKPLPDGRMFELDLDTPKLLHEVYLLFNWNEEINTTYYNYYKNNLKYEFIYLLISMICRTRETHPNFFISIILSSTYSGITPPFFVCKKICGSTYTAT